MTQIAAAAELTWQEKVLQRIRTQISAVGTTDNDIFQSELKTSLVDFRSVTQVISNSAEQLSDRVINEVWQNPAVTQLRWNTAESVRSLGDEELIRAMADQPLFEELWKSASTNNSARQLLISNAERFADRYFVKVVSQAPEFVTAVFHAIDTERLRAERLSSAWERLKRLLRPKLPSDGGHSIPGYITAALQTKILVFTTVAAVGAGTTWLLYRLPSEVSAKPDNSQIVRRLDELQSDVREIRSSQERLATALASMNNQLTKLDAISSRMDQAVSSLGEQGTRLQRMERITLTLPDRIDLLPSRVVLLAEEEATRRSIGDAKSEVLNHIDQFTRAVASLNDEVREFEAAEHRLETRVHGEDTAVLADSLVLEERKGSTMTVHAFDPRVGIVERHIEFRLTSLRQSVANISARDIDTDAKDSGTLSLDQPMQLLGVRISARLQAVHRPWFKKHFAVFSIVPND